MVGRRRKSQQLHAASVISSSRAAASVKEEEEEDREGHSKPAGVSGLRHAPCAVKVKKEEIDDDHSKSILDGCKMVHVQQRPARRVHRAKYGKNSRYAHIMSIANRMKLSPNSLVAEVEARLFHNVFSHLIDAIVSSQTAGSDEKAIEVNIGSDSLVTLVGREFFLKKILARRRLYSPPSDSEVVYYREIKRHIRHVIAYHEAKGESEDVQWAYSKDPAGYHSLSCSQTISAVEELTELTGSLAQLSSHFRKLSQKNDLAPESAAIHVRMDFKSLPEPKWNVKKTNAFYYSKLILVLHDLKCSGLEGLSPESSEKKSINTLLDYVTFSHLRVNKEYKVFDSPYECEPVCAASTRKRGRDPLIDGDNDEDFYPMGPLMFTAGFFYGKLEDYMKRLRRSCLNSMLDIMGRLEPVPFYPVTLFPVDDNNIMLEWLKGVKFRRPRNSVNDVHQSILLARYAASLIQGVSSSVDDACAELTDMLRRRQHYEFSVQALLVLLLLDCGAYRKTGQMMATLQDGADSKDNGANCGDGNTDNTNILASILRILKDIGTSNALDAPTASEVIILDQIMEHVSLCIDGFLCSKAYQKERDLRCTPRHKIAKASLRHFPEPALGLILQHTN